MVFNDIKYRNGNSYYYRVCSFRNGKKISKKRFYLGKNLSKEELKSEAIKADRKIYEFQRKRKGEFDKIKKKLKLILREKGIDKAGVFGSYARGEQRKDSDFDLLVKLNKNLSGLKFIKFREELSKKLNKKVDVITYRGINPLLKKRIIDQEVRII